MMATVFSEAHAATQTLLPWYVNGRIDESDKRIVEAHLQGCPECRAELESERRLGGAVAGLSLEAEQGWVRMQRKLRGHHKASRPAWSGRWQFAGGLLAAQAAAVLLFVAMTGQPGVSPDRYQTLSAPQTSPASGTAALVMFRPDATERALRAAVASVDGRIVDGPTDADAYVLHFAGAEGPALVKLKSDPAVLLAEPIR